MNFADSATALLTDLGSGPVFVHSDVFRTARLVPPAKRKSDFLDNHLELLRRLGTGRTIWMPAFNYEFPRSRVFDVAGDESQVGPLTEKFRRSAPWRTPVPMFSVSGTGDNPQLSWGDNTDPFGADSIFSNLVENDGVMFYYGDTFDSNTLVHYSEWKYGGPPYRYDKRFAGTVVMPDGDTSAGELCCHVRPMGKNLDYDWPRLYEAALEAGVCRRVENAPEVSAASARALSDFWVDSMTRDPLCLLDDNSRAWVEPKLEKLGRRFTLEDFEPAATGPGAT